MNHVDMCPECGAPELVTSEHLWLNNGDIVHKRAQDSRMLFIETENLDPLFQGIEQIVGIPLEHMIITAARRAYRIYLTSFVPDEVRKRILSGELDYGAIDESFCDLARLNGVGSYHSVERRYEQDDDDFDTVSISEPYSIPLVISGHVGAVESLTTSDLGYTFEEKSPGYYLITCFPSPHPTALSDRLWFQPYRHEDGDFELARCATCGGPEMLSGFQWYAERGVILSKATGRRMAIQGAALLDPVFRELEAELGDAIPRAVVEAQRRFTRSGYYTTDDINDEGDFRTHLALRGLGNLKELSMTGKLMRIRVDNAALHLITLGFSQGLFEMGFGLEASDIDWEFSQDGMLEAEVKPRA